MSTQPTILKAYHVQGDEYGCIRFASSNVVARREGAQELDKEFNEVTCKRIPGADKYADSGRVSSYALVEEFGWWQECGYCSCHVDNETENRVWSDNTAYCDSECEARRINIDIDIENDRAKKTADEADGIAQAVKAFPGITNVLAYHDFKNRLTVNFNFPGGSERAAWLVGSDTVYSADRDAEAFKAYHKSLNKPEANDEQ